MPLNDSIIDEYQNLGVTVLRNIISQKWIKKLQLGIKKIFRIQVSINVYMKKIKIKNYFMTIIVIGKELMSIKISSLDLILQK